MPRLHTLAFHLVAAASALASGSLGAQDSAKAPPFVIPRLTEPVVVDGDPSDAAWAKIPPLPLTMYAPVFRGTPSQRTEIRVAYDDEYFYAAGWFFDTDSAGIRVNSLYRDRWNGDDAFAIYIDAFDDKRNSKWFGTTPAGIRFDVLVSDDGATSNDSWDTFWTSRTTIRSDGWFAEVRIPFSSIGFHVDASGRAAMGLLVTRLISRTGERMTFPDVDPRSDFRRPSVARDVVLQDVDSHKPLYLTPYALTGRQRTAQTPPLGALSKSSNEMGLDIRYPMTGQLTVDLTANTDFAQVEADDEQVNLDRFPLYFPERRRFFQEGSGVFDFTLANGTRLFNSRRIGLTTDAQRVPVIGGARVVGQADGWDIGLLDMHTKALGISPRESFDVARLRHAVFNDGSTIGGMITRYSSNARLNTAAGLDGVFRIADNQYITAKWAGTNERGDTAPSDLFGRSQIDFRLDRRVQKGLQYNVVLSHAGRDFLPEIGFVQRSDFTTANVGGNYYFFTDSSRLFRRVYPGALAFSTWRNADHALESGQYAVWVEWDTKAGGGGWIEPKWFHENVLDAFSITPSATVPRGSYDFADLQFQLSMSTGRKLRTDLDTRAGTYFDGTRAQAILTPTWNVSPHLELSTDYQITRLRFPTRAEKADIQLARLRVRAAMNARASANTFVQYNSVTHQVNVNARLRYAFAEGTDLWFVYDEGLDTDRAVVPGLSRTPLSLSRTVLVKYTRTFGF